jgi:hypothetical protein
MPGDVHKPLDPRRDASERGTPAKGRDPAAPPAMELPPDNPAWVPGAVSDRIHRLYGGRLAEQPKDELWFPHLLIRAAPGDTGARPVWEPVPCWLSPDLHLIPSGAPLDLAQAVQQPVAGKSYTVLVHVWNLGRFPAFGVTVRAWWVEPGFFAGTPDPLYQPHYIGGTFTELGDRNSGEAHRLVRIPQPWTVVPNNEAHECLMAVVESFADPWTGVLAPNADRHVGQRNLTIFVGAADAEGLLGQLDKKLKAGDRLTLDAGPVAPAWLGGAMERGVARSADSAPGRGPLNLGPPMARLAKLRKGDATWPAGDDRQPRGLAGAVRTALGARGTTAAHLLAGKALAQVGLGTGPGGSGAAALHLGAQGGGYSIVLIP